MVVLMFEEVSYLRVSSLGFLFFNSASHGEVLSLMTMHIYTWSLCLKTQSYNWDSTVLYTVASYSHSQ